MTPDLIRNFDEAALICQAETQGLLARLRQRLLGSVVPRWNPARWPSAASHNCYNFAVNNKTAPVAFPGAFAPEPVKPNRYYFDTIRLHGAVHEGALKDGLVYLGDHFLKAASTQNIAPVALFMREPGYLDFHWMALRRRGDDLFWAHIPGAQAAATRLYKGECIFKTAGDRGYHLFGGYYGVPAHMLNASRPSSSLI